MRFTALVRQASTGTFDVKPDTLRVCPIPCSFEVIIVIVRVSTVGRTVLARALPSTGGTIRRAAGASTAVLADERTADVRVPKELRERSCSD